MRLCAIALMVILALLFSGCIAKLPRGRGVGFGAGQISTMDPKDSMGMYSLKKSALSGSRCRYVTSNYVDPVNVVFTYEAWPSNVKKAALLYGFPYCEGFPYCDGTGEQRMYELNTCSFEDVDAGQNAGHDYPFDPVTERFHFRGWYGAEHKSLRYFTVATAHFDDDDDSCGHFVPEEFPYPEEPYAGSDDSGFDAGRGYLWWKFVVEGPMGVIKVEDWRNDQWIEQKCGDDQSPRSDGEVWFIALRRIR